VQALQEKILVRARKGTEAGECEGDGQGEVEEQGETREDSAVQGGNVRRIREGYLCKNRSAQR
jgi:hypothetical protein